MVDIPFGLSKVSDISEVRMSSEAAVEMDCLDFRESEFEKVD